MKKITKFALCGLVATLGLTTAASCANNGTAKEVLDKVLVTQDGGKVSADFTVPKKVLHNSNQYDVTWTSSDTSVLDFVDLDASKYTADVKRPFGDEAANKEVTFTATVSADGGKASASYKTTVEAIAFDAAAQAAVKAIGIANSYNKDKVTSPVEITLPSKSTEYSDEIALTYTLGTYTSVKVDGDKLTIDPTTGAEEKAELKVTAKSGSLTKDITVVITVNGPTDITSKCTVKDGKVTIPYDAITADGKYSISLGKDTVVVVEWTGYVDDSKYKEIGINKSSHVSLTVEGDAYVIYSLISDVYGTYDNMKTYQGKDATGTAIKPAVGKGASGTSYTYTLSDATNVYFDNSSTYKVDLYSLAFTYGEKGKAPTQETPEKPKPVAPAEPLKSATAKHSEAATTNIDKVDDPVTALGLNDYVFDVTFTGCTAGKNTNQPGLNKDGTIRLYNNTEGEGNSLTFTVIEGYRIDSITVTLSTSTDTKNSGTLQVYTTASNILTAGENGVYTVNGNSVTIKNVATESSHQLWIVQVDFVLSQVA
ncbi:MAG: hypothetical protein K2K48_00965 [Anaeroplasmataceae bacterium]|nr:hypothetical protein [Anaeroplasmataceae bacterium]MDE6413965.1 hypothetical protein [Anaeroplasmataceae bacterium]